MRFVIGTNRKAPPKPAGWLSLKDIMDKLPPEAQKWLNGMSREDFNCTEGIFNTVGEESFFKHLGKHKLDWEYLRDF